MQFVRRCAVSQTIEAIKEAEMILQLSTGGVSHNQSRNGEAEAVYNDVGCESVAQGGRARILG